MVRNSLSLSTTDSRFIFESFQIFAMLSSCLYFLSLSTEIKWRQIVKVRVRRVASVIQNIL